MTSPDDITTPPVAPYRWAEGIRVRKRGTAGPIWTVVSQHGPLVQITRATSSGSISMHECWSALVLEPTHTPTP
jgi:hypothetical protein